jgi:hypothetical protein
MCWRGSACGFSNSGQEESPEVAGLRRPDGDDVGFEELADSVQNLRWNLSGVEPVHEGTGKLGEDGLALIGEALLEFDLAGAGGGHFLVVTAEAAEEEVGFAAGEAKHEDGGGAEREIDLRPDGVVAADAPDEKVGKGDDDGQQVEFAAQEPMLEGPSLLGQHGAIRRLGIGAFHYRTRLQY